jgi:CRP-like cAMP-binding protein
MLALLLHNNSVSQFMPNPFTEYLSSIVSLDAESIKMIEERTKEVAFSKGHVIASAGTVCRYAYFLISGEARSYYTNFSGKTITWSFHFNQPSSNVKNLMIADYKSFLTGLPATLTSETLTSIRAIQVSKIDLDYVLEHSLICERAMRKMSEGCFIVAYDRAFTLLTMSASERYRKMIEEEPHLLKMFSNQYIASYLGITPQSLSRIRSKNLS